MRIIEIGGDSDDRILDGFTQIRLSGFLHLVQDEASNLRGRVFLAASLNPSVSIGVLHDLIRNFFNVPLNLGVRVLATDQALGGKKGVFGVDDCLALGGYADETLAVLGESNNRRRSSGTCKVGVRGTFIKPALYSDGAGKTDLLSFR